MKKFTVFLLLSAVLFAYNIFISPNSVYVNKTSAKNYYILQKSYAETKLLVKLTNKMLNSKKFINLTYLKETSDTKVYTAELLKKLLNFLKGEKPYLNTVFENNGKNAGIKGILKDAIDSRLFNLPQKLKENMLNSINSSDFVSTEKKTEKLLNDVNKNNIKEIISNFNLLFDTYVNDINKLNIPLLKNFNTKIKQKLLKNYRIEAKTSIIKTLEIFKKYFNKNKKAYN